MAPLIKSFASGMLIIFSGHVSAATTEIKADIVDGTCQVSLSNASINFDPTNSTRFVAKTAEIRPLAVNLDCINMVGLSPSLSVTGESSGLTDTRLFRAASSTANYVGFMLKKGEVTDLSGFYNAEGTVEPGDVLAIEKEDGSSVQQFSVGLVHGAGDPMISSGSVNAHVTFAFVFP